MRGSVHLWIGILRVSQTGGGWAEMKRFGALYFSGTTNRTTRRSAVCGLTVQKQS